MYPFWVGWLLPHLDFRSNVNRQRLHAAYNPVCSTSQRWLKKDSCCLACLALSLAFSPPAFVPCPSLSCDTPTITCPRLPTSRVQGDLIIRTTLTPGLSVNGTGGCSLTAAFSQETAHQLIAPASTPGTLTIGGNIHVDAQCGEMRDINFRGLVVAGNVLVSASQGAFIQNFRIGHQYGGNDRSSTPGWLDQAATTIGGNLTIATASLGHIIQPVLLASDGTFRIGNRFHVVNTGGRLSGITAEPGVQLSAGSSMIIEESGVPDRESTGPLTDPTTGIVK